MIFTVRMRNVPPNNISKKVVAIWCHNMCYVPYTYIYVIFAKVFFYNYVLQWNPSIRTPLKYIYVP